MKITPLDIHHKKFRTSLRGYNVDEVDMFLDEVASELDRVFKENTGMKERLEEVQKKLEDYQTMEQTLHHALLNAQKIADDVTSNASKEAEKIMKKAKGESAEVLEAGNNQRKELLASIKRLQKLESQYKNRLIDVLEEYTRNITEQSELVDSEAIEKEDKITEEIDKLLPAKEETVEEEVTGEETAGEEASEEEAPGPGEGDDEVDSVDVSGEEEASNDETETSQTFEMPDGVDDGGDGKGNADIVPPPIAGPEDHDEEKNPFADLGEGVPGIMRRRRKTRTPSKRKPR